MDILELKEGVLKGDRKALSKSLTLVESRNAKHQKLARELIKLLLAHTGDSFRVGITGAPGVGKSTFIESLGKEIVSDQKSLAILTVDPTSPKSGGSILGDKTRMQEISHHEKVMIRPSPSGLSGGGISSSTRDQILVCEAAGFDVVIIETVGSGQGETAIGNVVDFLLLLLQAGGGDELQGIKRGIMEIANLFVFTKSDITDPEVLNQSNLDLKNALHLLHTNEIPGVFNCASIKNEGISDIWDFMQGYYGSELESGELAHCRTNQEIGYFDSLIRNMILARISSKYDLESLLNESIKQIKNKQMTADSAAERVIHELFGEKG